MWFITRKRHREKITDWAELWEEDHRIQAKIIAGLEKHKKEQAAILKSTEREQVLNDLQDALNLIRGYQRSLSIMSVADTHIVAANALLDKYGMKPDAHATYLGFQRTVTFKEPKLDVPQGADLSTDSLTTTIPPKEGAYQSRWDREEEEWGNEAYGKGNVRIEADAIDEGDTKEPGHTRAHIHFVDLDADES